MAITWPTTPTFLLEARKDQYNDAGVTYAVPGDAVYRSILQIPTGGKYVEHATANNRPYLLGGTKIGPPSIEFPPNATAGGGNRYLHNEALGLGAAIGTQNTTILVCGTCQLRQQSGAGVIQNSIAVKTGSYVVDDHYGLGVYGNEIVQYNGGLAATPPTPKRSGLFAPHTRAVWGYRADGTNVTFVSGKLRTTQAVGASGSSNSSISIGGGYLGGLPFIGAIDQLVAWGSALTDSQLRSAVESMQDEFGIVRDPKTLICYIGDSNTAGMGQPSGTYASDNMAWTRKVDMALTGGGGHVSYNCGIYNQKASQWVSNWTANGVGTIAAAHPEMAKIAVVWAGGPDLGAGDSAATVLANLVSLVGLCRASGFSYVIVCTIPPRTGSAGPEAARVSLNASILAGNTGANAVVDVDGLFPATVSYATPKDNPFWINQADDIHIRGTGHSMIALPMANAIRAVTHVDIGGVLKFGPPCVLRNRQ